MGVGRSIHIGINEIDPNHYGSSLEPLIACGADMDLMQSVAGQQGFSETTTMFNHDATRDHFLSKLIDVSNASISGDFVFISYSGHGSQIPSLTGALDENDAMDETWCLFDTQLLDSEIYQVLSNFRKGVRVLILLDSCHSGTAIHEWIHASWGMLDQFMRQENLRSRHMRAGARNHISQKHKSEYQQRQSDVLPFLKNKIKASVCLMAACQDNQRAIENTFNGMFTDALMMEMNDHPNHNYKSLHKGIHKHLHAFQSPNIYTMGLGINAFLKQTFLTI